MFHMGWFLSNGFGVYGWNQQWSGNVAADVAQPGLFVDMATSLERAGVKAGAHAVAEEAKGASKPK